MGDVSVSITIAASAAIASDMIIDTLTTTPVVCSRRRRALRTTMCTSFGATPSNACESWLVNALLLKSASLTPRMVKVERTTGR